MASSMDDSTPRSTTPGFPPDDGTFAVTDPAVPPRPQYIAYRPPNSEFTPPASPQPQQSPYAAKKGFSSHRAKLPANLQMDVAIAPAYERPQYSPSPSSSPPLPPALPSPKFPSRQRAPSLLRHAAISSPLNNGFPRAEQPSSPTFASPMMRQASNTSATSDPRTFFNPLASNPVNHNGPSWDSSSEDQLSDMAHHQQQQRRMRAMTNSSQNSFVPHPLLRAATSIPDYAPFRNSERSNLSGTYKPNRGGANWSHNDYYPPPMRFRGEEGRASYRSGQTNASSFMEASGTERSSMATGRSSLSEYRESTYSRDRSRDRSGERSRDHSQVRNISPETIQTTDMENDDVMSAVEDVIDAYCYDDDEDEERREHSRQLSLNALSSSPIHLDSEPPELSQTPSRDHDSLDSFHTSDHTRQWDSTSQHNLDQSQTEAGKDRVAGTPKIEADDMGSVGFDATTEAILTGEKSSRHTSYLPHLQPLSPINVQYDDDIMEQQRKSDAWHRASEEIPRRASGMRLSSIPVELNQHQHARVPSASRSQMQEIHKELKNLPRLPTKKSRMSRQDWANIEAYSKRHSKRPSGPRQNYEEFTPQSPPKKQSDPLPEVDQDEAFPRRASTSVYDRKSTLLLLGAAIPPPPPAKPAATESVTPTSPISRRPIGRVLSPVERDRYGFKKATINISVPEYDAWAGKYEEHISRRRNKWIALMNKQGLSTTNPVKFPDQCEKVKRYARKGYPPEWRGAMWWYYSGGQYLMSQPGFSGVYASLVKRVNNGELNKDDREAIERDLDRTFPDNIHFRPDPTPEAPDGKPPIEPVLIQDLREVLSAFALHNPSIGYCQSLNFIAGLLLLFLKQDNERVFILLMIITQNHLPGAHARSLANTEVNVLMMLIKDYLPKVWASINDTDIINSGAGSHAHPDSKFQRQPTIALSCTSWFMSIFVGVLPVETVLRVWDAFLYEGPRALYRYALAIFKLGEPEIRKYRPGDGELFMTVQNLPRRCLDPNVLHDLAFVKKGFGSLTQNVIDQKRMFWRDQNKMGHQTSVRRIDTADVDTESVKKPGAMSGLRRKASRKLLRRK